MKLDKLNLNSEIILIGTKPQLNKIKFDHTKVGHVDLSVETAAVRNLGAWFDRNLSMSTYINKICAVCILPSAQYQTNSQVPYAG